MKLLLTSYQKVNTLVEEMIESEGNRFGELWLPIGVMLRLVETPEEERNEIKEYCERQHSLNRYELNDWDYTLVEIVTELQDEEITAEDAQTDFTKKEIMSVKLKKQQQDDFPVPDISKQAFSDQDILELELKDFISNVRNRTTPSVSGIEGRRALDIALQVVDQINKNRAHVEKILAETSNFPLDS